MNLLSIGILILLAGIAGRLQRGRGSVLLAGSVFVIYWLQPTEGYGGLAFWLPTCTLALVVLTWAVTVEGEARSFGKNWPAMLLLAAAVLLVDLNRYVKLAHILPVADPRPFWVLGIIVLVSSIVFALLHWPRFAKVLLPLALTAIVAVFVILKLPLASQEVLRRLSTTPGAAAGSGATLSWLGFSYVAFRLLHTVRDRQSGRLPSATLEDFANYVIFFPAFAAGPIDRLERFMGDLHSPVPLNEAGWLEAGTRLLAGVAKKFVVADMLALIALNDTLAARLTSPWWTWFFLYVYSLRIYFDFSGYTDLAVGMARLLGVRLPENFAAPYLKPNLTLFWNSWHMTLAGWFRSYYFNPLTRFLNTSKFRPPALAVIFFSQVTTMLLIGLWHGITWNFALWGLWHGFGLFVHNRWSDFMRTRSQPWMSGRLVAAVVRAAGIFLTFNFVSLGWLFFSLSTPDLVWKTFLKLLGAA